MDCKAREQFFGNVWTRIKGGFESNKCSALIDAIDNDISKINRLTGIALEVECLRLERDRRKKARIWANIRDSANSLSEMLRLKWANPCTCQFSHRANMLLKAQMDEEADNDDEAEQSRFELLLVFDKATSLVPAVAYKWRDVEIQCSEIVQATTIRSPRKGVRFHNDTPTNPTAIAPATSHISKLSGPEIDNLCRSLGSQTSVNRCLGYLEDHLRRHHLFLTSGVGAQNQVVPDASLHHLLLETGKVTLGPRMKCTVALALAVAVLRLYDTPWLLPSWDLCDIYFLRDTRGNYLLDRPYVSFPIGTPTAIKAQRAYRRRLVKNEIIFALGVALIELSYAKPLPDLTEASDLDKNGNRDIITEYATATRLAELIHHQELPNYAKATQRCINCNFETSDYDLNDQDFRGRFYEGVVMPLRADWEYATR
ncbi:hypothetical protein H2204_007608 [Knufia peltigerae]|uniref:DUF7580 domain-containing protein n=1 Tax=Knufia peltigerae TaxID=1002370 RepID=A0AA39CXT0_9EURO|nr:hypothetical protein H2204_007608 [Knufia peltigerae]